MRRAITLLVAVLLAGLFSTPAHAGRYTVSVCDAGGVLWGNGAFALFGALPAGITNDNACVLGGENIDLEVKPGARTPEGTEVTYRFAAPPQTTIANFSLSRQIRLVNPAVAGTHRYYAILALGPRVFAGAGDYDDAVRAALNRSKAWYGYPAADVDTKRGSLTLAGNPSLAGYRGDATVLSLRVGCFRRGTPCALGAGGGITNALYGATITLEDRTPPSELAVEASGLFAGGERNGADRVTIASASDNAGVRRVELVDVTDPAAPRTVGAEDYDTGATDAGATCSFRLARPCPQLKGETLAATSLEAGQRRLIVRATDIGGNVRDSAAATVDVVVPSDRGAANGTDATEGATLSASFSSRRALGRRTASFGTRSRISGRLRNEAGRPVAGAVVDVVTRDADRDAPVKRAEVRTRADGSFSYRAQAYVTRRIAFTWRARLRDARPAAAAEVEQRVRATASLRARPRTVRLRRPIRLTGRLAGRLVSGVSITLEGRGAGTRRFQTFRRVTTGRGGRFSATVRLVRPGSRGSTFSFRARVLPTGGHPYVAGVGRTARVRVR